MDLIFLALSVPLMMALSFVLDVGSKDETEDSTERTDETATDTAALTVRDDLQTEVPQEADHADYEGGTFGWDGMENYGSDMPAQQELFPDPALEEEDADASTTEDWADTAQEEELFPDPEEPEEHPVEAISAADWADQGDDVSSDDVAAEDTGPDLFPEAEATTEDEETAEADAADGTLWSSGDTPVTLEDFDPSQDRIALELSDPEAELSLAPSENGADTEVQLDGETLLVLQGVLLETLPEDAVSGVLAGT